MSDGTRRIAMILLAWFAALTLLAGGTWGADAPPPAEPSRQEIHRLIEQLGDKDYFVRQQAEASLARLGFEAFDALSEATTHEDLEIAARAKRLLQLMKVQWFDKGDPPRVRQILHDYEQNAETRQSNLLLLSMLPDQAGLPALCRLVRYEKSALLSKQAALRVLASQKTAAPPSKEVAEALRTGLAGNRRPGGQWLLAWLRSADDPRGMTEQWARAIAAEEATLRNAPSQSSAEFVTTLLRCQIPWLTRLGLASEAAAATHSLIQWEKGDPETLLNLLQWLIDQKDWKSVHELAERFGPQISAQPALLYAVAEAQAAEGDTSRAEQTAQQAVKLFPGQQPQEIFQHRMMAMSLEQRGLFAWSKREFRHVIDQGLPTAELTLRTQYQLSEMLHDQAEDIEAAEGLQQVVQAVGAGRPAEAQVAGRTLGEVRSRMDFFFACHWDAKGDQAKRREYLAKALADDPGDIDVLIGCYRLPDATREYRDKIRGLIEKAAADLRDKISDEPENAANYNQFAWLIGNTEGNQDEALQYSKKSVELSPEAGGYFDTLARVYFAKHDYQSAVKYQTKAAELDPHSGQILRQLELFRKKRESP